METVVEKLIKKHEMMKRPKQHGQLVKLPEGFYFEISQHYSIPVVFDDWSLKNHFCSIPISWSFYFENNLFILKIVS